MNIRNKGTDFDAIVDILSANDASILTSLQILHELRIKNHNEYTLEVYKLLINYIIKMNDIHLLLYIYDELSHADIIDEDW